MARHHTKAEYLAVQLAGAAEGILYEHYLTGERMDDETADVLRGYLQAFYAEIGLDWEPTTKRVLPLVAL